MKNNKTFSILKNNNYLNSTNSETNDDFISDNKEMFGIYKCGTNIKVSKMVLKELNNIIREMTEGIVERIKESRQKINKNNINEFMVGNMVYHRFYDGTLLKNKNKKCVVLLDKK